MPLTSGKLGACNLQYTHPFLFINSEKLSVNPPPEFLVVRSHYFILFFPHLFGRLIVINILAYRPVCTLSVSIVQE